MILICQNKYKLINLISISLCITKSTKSKTITIIRKRKNKNNIKTTSNPRMIRVRDREGHTITVFVEEAKGFLELGDLLLRQLLRHF